MKYYCGLSDQYKKEQKEKWHEWYAWYPVTVNIDKLTGRKTCAFLQRVLRKGYMSYCSQGFYWFYQYKEFDGG